LEAEHESAGAAADTAAEGRPFLEALHAILSYRPSGAAAVACLDTGLILSGGRGEPSAFSLDSSVGAFAYHHDLLGEGARMRDATAELKALTEALPTDSKAARVTSLDKVFQREMAAAADAEYDHRVKAFYEANPILSFTLELPHEKPAAPPAPLVAEPCRALALAAAIPAPAAALQLGHKGATGVPAWAVSECRGLFKPKPYLPDNL